MNTAFKIRVLLFLLAIGFVGTAYIINATFSKQDILKADSREVETRLQQKEQFAKKYLNNAVNFQALKTIGSNEELSSKLIPEFRTKRKLYLFTYQKHLLKFWGANRLIAESDAGLQEGVSLVKWQNGWYEAIKKSENDFSTVIFIPIKAEYPYQNTYLENDFATDITTSNNIEIADFNVKSVYNVKTSEGKYLFSIKLKSSITHQFYSKYELWIWILSLLFSCVFIYAWCASIAEKGKVKLAIFIFTAFILLGRILCIKSNWLGSHFDIGIFDSKYFSYGLLFPSMGEFLLNLIGLTWCLTFAYTYRFQIKLSVRLLSRQASIVIFVGLLTVIFAVAGWLNDVFYHLIINSKINFDLTNILNLQWLSWLGIVLLCLAALSLYLLLETLLIISNTLNLDNKKRLIIFIACLLLVLVYKLFESQFNFFFIPFALIILIRAWAIYNKTNDYNLSIFVFTLLVFASIASIKLSNFQFYKERENRKLIAQKLDSADDPNAVLLFDNLEQEILKDELVKNYYKSQSISYKELNNKFQKFYFDGYLSRFDYKTYQFNTTGKSIDSNSTVKLDYYKNLVINNAIKVSDYFYRINNTFGYQDYFALLPVISNRNNIGTLVIELKSKPFNDPRSFPAVLADGKIEDERGLKNYSFAFYHNGRLLNQYGKYIYNLANYDFQGKSNVFVFVEKDGYSHLIYQTNARKLIIVSKKNINAVLQLASVSFLFLVILIFSILIIFFDWLIRNLNFHSIREASFSIKKITSTNQILYRTRIQALLVAVVIFTLVLVGGITYFSLSLQYHEQQEASILERINKIVAGFESQMFNKSDLKITEDTFNAFADVNAVDLNYFDINGRLIFTTQPKVYDYGLISERMNALAYVYMNNYQRSEYINPEVIGRMEFITVYKPIRNSRNETVAYLSLPYFANVQDYEERVGQFLNTLLNVYALALVAIGFFAVFMANRITYPLTLLQRSLSQTKMGRKNEPLKWNRNDEIGNLIKEYNNMIEALEDSAQRIARSEREIAWKEMAKQIAHEIKNPLTPLKLGVQLLDKSWKENDPNFNKKFERFSKSFLEQIESLAHIANEFSNFAKMPETQFSNVSIKEILQKSIEPYSANSHVAVTLDDRSLSFREVKADHEQLLKCFNNLIKNAIEAIPEHKRGEVKIVIEQEQSLTHIRIRDNGKGIPDGLRERIFNPNFTTKSSGTGLGLAFVKQAIENMMGTISFETELDKGTTFYITLPLVT